MSVDTAAAKLIAVVIAFVRRYVVLTEDQATAVALWIVHTHAAEALGITPYLAITSAEKQSAKTLLLEVLELLTRKPWLTGSVTAATLARKIDEQCPTLLLDESDAAFKGDKEYAETLRGVLNTGYKSSGTYSRCAGTSGTNLKVVDFRTFCPKAIAGIGKLPDTVADRSIPIRLKRKAPHEKVERKRERKITAEAAPLRDQIAEWAGEHDAQLANLDLAALDGLSDRAADIWEPLLGIAYLAGEEWFTLARRAALRLSGLAVREDDSASVQLLTDIRAVLNGDGVDRIASAALAAALNQIEESPWCEWRGKPITTHGIVGLLKRYEIHPGSIRIGDWAGKGYKREDFEDAWNRYLAPVPPSVTVTTSQPASLSQKEGEAKGHTDPLCDVSQNGANPHEQGDVTVVTVSGGGMAVEEVTEPPFEQTEMDGIEYR